MADSTVQTSLKTATYCQIYPKKIDADQTSTLYIKQMNK